jgi:type I restriction enzyme S subunit
MLLNLLNGHFLERFSSLNNKGGTQKFVSLGDIRKMIVPIPPLQLQNQFAERVAVIEEQKAIAQKSLEKSEELFNSLLQKAFKGELCR